MKQKPAASQIQNILKENIQLLDIQDFFIRKSEDNSDEITLISPDIAVCSECVSDLKTNIHRIGYPLINCSHCGPRFTIITVSALRPAKYKHGHFRNVHYMPDRV